MKEFTTLAGFAKHLERLAAQSHAVGEHVVEAASEDIQETAIGMIGFYQQAIGPYPAWAPLADSTEAHKARMGYEPDAPLLASGEMQRSIERYIRGLEAVVGTQDEKMIYHEFGTRAMPPRPVLGPAGMHSAPRIARMAGVTALAWLSGANWRATRIAYSKTNE